MRWREVGKRKGWEMGSWKERVGEALFMNLVSEST
jgi:hypothetical protein